MQTGGVLLGKKSTTQVYVRKDGISEGTLSQKLAECLQKKEPVTAGVDAMVYS